MEGESTNQKELTYKDLKALYRKDVFLEKKVISHVYYQILVEIMPLFSDDIDWFIHHMSGASKNSLAQRDKKGLLRGMVFTWNNNYLDDKDQYKKLGRKFNFIFRRHVMSQADEDEIEIQTLGDLINFFKNLIIELTDQIDKNLDKDYDEIVEEFKTAQDKETKRLKSFIELSFASVFNYVSLIQNKATISKLLRQAIEENKPENFKKIFNVDPTVYHLAEVQNFIKTLDWETESRIAGYYFESSQIPAISNRKNQISQKPLFLIGLMNTMGIINGEFALSKTRLYKLGIAVGIDSIKVEQTYFNRLLKHVKNS